jgi:hypothetical protein
LKLLESNKRKSNELSDRDALGTTDDDKNVISKTLKHKSTKKRRKVDFSSDEDKAKVPPATREIALKELKENMKDMKRSNERSDKKEFSLDGLFKRLGTLDQDESDYVARWINQVTPSNVKRNPGTLWNNQLTNYP